MENNFRNTHCLSCSSANAAFFGKLNEDGLSQIDSHKKCSFLRKKQALFTEGTYPRGVFCINEGKVKIYKSGEEGKEQIIQIATAGDLVGFRAMLAEDVYKVSAVTLEDCNICFIPKEAFLSIIDANAVLRNGIIKELSKELAQQAEFITNMAQKSVRQRLAVILLILKDIYQEEPINLSREDLANFVGTATETLIRLLKDLKEEGLIDTQTRKISVIDPKKLVRVSQL